MTEQTWHAIADAEDAAMVAAYLAFLGKARGRTLPADVLRRHRKQLRLTAAELASAADARAGRVRKV